MAVHSPKLHFSLLPATIKHAMRVVSSLRTLDGHFIGSDGVGKTFGDRQTFRTVCQIRGRSMNSLHGTGNGNLEAYVFADSMQQMNRVKGGMDRRVPV